MTYMHIYCSLTTLLFDFHERNQEALLCNDAQKLSALLCHINIVSMSLSASHLELLLFFIYASGSSLDNGRILNQPVDVHCFDLGVLVLPYLIMKSSEEMNLHQDSFLR